jgi:hypothetical protein
MTRLTIFPGSNRWCRAKHRDQLAVTASFDAQNAKAIVAVMESDAFDHAG